MERKNSWHYLFFQTMLISTLPFLLPVHCALVVQCAQCKMHWLRIFTMYNAPVERMYYANVHWLIRVQCALVGGKPAFQWSIEVSAGEGGKGRPQLGRGRLTESFGAIGPQFFCLHMFGLFWETIFPTHNWEYEELDRGMEGQFKVGQYMHSYFIQPFGGKCL